MVGTRFSGLILGAVAVFWGCGGQAREEVSGGASAGAPSTTGDRSESGEGGRPTGGGDTPSSDSGGAAGEPNPEPEAMGGTRGEVGGGPSPSGGAGDVEDVCPMSPGPLRTEFVWRRERSELSGVKGLGRIAYSADGSRIVTPPDQYVIRGHTVHRATDGEVLESDQIVWLDRDRSWSRELRGEGRSYQLDGLQVVDLQSGSSLLSLAGPPAAARLSDDGRYLAAFYCADAPRLERHALDGDSVVRLSLANQASACAVEDYYYENLAAAAPMAFSGAAIAYPIDGRERIAVADVETQTIDEVVLEPVSATPEVPEDALLALEFAPSGSLLGSVVSRSVRVVHHPGHTRALPDFPAGVTLAFTNCYCEQRRFSPLAWSADERYFAMIDPDRAVLVRRSCDGAQVARIEEPTSTASSPTLLRDVPGPAFLAFAPDGKALAIYSIAGRTSSISVYRLEE